LIHSHYSCRPSGDCGGSRDRTRNCCVAVWFTQSRLSQLSHHIDMVSHHIDLSHHIDIVDMVRCLWASFCVMESEETDFFLFLHL
jgi:hypothetical protein